MIAIEKLYKKEEEVAEMDDFDEGSEAEFADSFSFEIVRKERKEATEEKEKKEIPAGLAMELDIFDLVNRFVSVLLVRDFPSSPIEFEFFREASVRVKSCKSLAPLRELYNDNGFLLGHDFPLYLFNDARSNMIDLSDETMGLVELCLKRHERRAFYIRDHVFLDLAKKLKRMEK